MESDRGALRALVATRARFGSEAAARKHALLDRLAAARLATARDVESLHECLCFLRAYPDDAGLLRRVERLLRGFAARPDLRRHRAALADTGIAGTDIYYRFFWFTAAWLARRWPDRLTIDWRSFEHRERLRAWLPRLATHAEAPLFEDERPVHALVDVLRGPRTTDATFLVRRVAALRTDSFLRETLYEDLDPMLRLAPGAGTPSRTLAHRSTGPVTFQRRALDGSRPDLRRAVRTAPRSVRRVAPGEARRWIDLARAAMVTRSRDLDAFETADPRDVRLVDCGDGLAFACFGAVPERRFLLDAVFGFLTLHNGVPIGYVLASVLFESALVMYNVFETFRGGESACIYGRVLGTVRYLFGCDAFAVDPYQLGHHNPEGLRSGAWWFYYKLGFRPRDAGVQRIAAAELQRMRRDPRHRSSTATLRRLAAAPVFWAAGRPRRDVLGAVSLAQVGAAVAAQLAQSGADREAALRACEREARVLLGVRATRRRSAATRLAWERWAPLVVTLPGVAGWSRAERRALAAVIDAKGARSEIDYVRRFDAHARLRRAVLQLAAVRP